MNVFKQRLLLVAVLLAATLPKAAAQFPIHIWINAQGRPQVMQLTGAPYEIEVDVDQGQQNPLQFLRLTAKDSIKRMDISRYRPSDTGFVLEDSYKEDSNRVVAATDFYNESNILVQEAYFQKPKRLKRPVPDDDRLLVLTAADRTPLQRTYNQDGFTTKLYYLRHQSKVYKLFPVTYFFYAAPGKPSIVLTLRGDREGVDETLGQKELQKMIANSADLGEYQDYLSGDCEDSSLYIRRLSAFRYNTAGKPTSCITYEPSTSVLMMDSIKYNSRGLPDTVDCFTYGTPEGSRRVFYYRPDGKILKITERYLADDFRARLEVNRNDNQYEYKYFYNEMGNIAKIEQYVSRPYYPSDRSIKYPIRKKELTGITVYHYCN